MTSGILKACWSFFLIVLLQACTGLPPVTETAVTEEISTRTGLAVEDTENAEGFWIPPSVNIDDGLAENEAAIIALANNARFQADLAELGLARADLITAGELPNPVFTLLFPVDTSLNEFSLAQMLSFLWQRPKRMQASSLNVDQVADNLIQNGLALVMNTNIAHAEYIYTRDNARLSQSLADVLKQMAGILEAKLKAGDASETEAAIIQNDALLMQDDAINARYEADAASYRLKTLMGFDEMTRTIEPVAEEGSCETSFDTQALLEQALNARPDLAAAKINISQTGEKLGLEKANILNLTATLDANEQPDGEYDLSPRLDIELPILSQNQGGRARAKVELEQAMSEYLAKKHEVSLQVHDAIAQTSTSCERLSYWQKEIFPRMQQQDAMVNKAYDAGEIAYLSVLTNQQKLIGAQRSMASAVLNQKKAMAKLNFSVGQKVTGDKQK